MRLAVEQVSVAADAATDRAIAPGRRQWREQPITEVKSVDREYWLRGRPT